MEPSPIVLARIMNARLREAYTSTARRGWTPLMQAIVDGDDAPAITGDLDAIADGGDSALSLAVAAGRDAVVARLLAAGADVDHVLPLAVPTGSLALVQMLLAAGAPIDGALELAVRHGRRDLLELLLDQTLHWQSAFVLACARGDLAAVRMFWARHEHALREANGNEVMAAAARSGNPAVIEFLVDIGFAVDAFDLKEERSPLMHAVEAGHADAVRTLVARGARVDAQTEWFVTPLRVAIQTGNREMFELLRTLGAVGDDEYRDRQSPYWERAQDERSAVIERDDVETLALLVARGGTTDAGGTWHPPVVLDEALAEAVEAGSTHAIAYLLALGADPLADRRPAPLVRAIQACNGRAVRMMLACGPALAGVEITAWACGQRDPWILADLLAHGARPDGPSYARPISIAASNGRRRHAELLCDRGVALDARLLLEAARAGKTRFVEWMLDRESSLAAHLDAALFEAVRWPRTVDALVRRGANVAARDTSGNTILHLAAAIPQVAIDRYLDWIDVATPNRDGGTALHAAAWTGSVPTIEKLLAAGAAVDARDEAGRTPLHHACNHPRPGVVEVLLAAGAAIDVADHDGATPLHHAVDGGAAPVALLLGAGADPNVRDREGRTPRDRAERLGNYLRGYRDRATTLELLDRACAS